MKLTTYSASVLLIVTVIWSVQVDADPVTNWHETPFRIKAGGHLLDTFDRDSGGHAAPFLVDLNGDGRRDLVVGSIRGRFHFYRNVGTDAQPRFDDASSYLMAGAAADEPARVPNFCCVAAGPRIVDVDGDGVVDLTSGSYSPGTLYWFKGRSNGTFHARQLLTDNHALPILPDPSNNPYAYGPDQGINMMSNLAWTDWNDNGHPDVIIGNLKGQLFVRLNARGVMSDDSLESMPMSSQPQFMMSRAQYVPKGSEEILIDGGPASPEKHAAPEVADWDGDGLWDILLGSESGRVYWLRNSGEPGAPQFKERQEILGPGSTYHWVLPGEAPGRGTRVQIQAVDYNLDGKLDLLVGEWAVVQTPRPDLSQRERKRMETVRKELTELDERMGYKPEYFVRDKAEKYAKDKAAMAHAQESQREMMQYLVKFGDEQYPESLAHIAYYRSMGHVWVYLRR